MAETLSPEDLTLDELRVWLAPVIPIHAAFDGWTDDALARAAEQEGADPEIAALAFPGGATDMIAAWFAHVDTAMTERLESAEFDAQPVHKKIRAAVLERIAIVRPNKEAVRRALAILAMPQNASLAAKLNWRSADAMWRLAGDTATDFNHYSKRAILTGVYASTILAWLDDESEDEAETVAFLDRRLKNVADFEKLKSKFTGDPDRRFSVSRFLGRLRYPGR